MKKEIYFAFGILTSVLLVPYNSAIAGQSAAASISTMCDDGSFDKTVQNNRSAFNQGLLTHAENISTFFPVASTMSSCVQQLTTELASLPNLANPLSGGGGIVKALLDAIVSSTCSAAMDSISSVQTGITNLAKICVPLPQFNLSLDLPTLKTTQCAGNLQLSLTTGFVPQPTNLYSFTQYQSH